MRRNSATALQAWGRSTGIILAGAVVAVASSVRAAHSEPGLSWDRRIESSDIHVVPDSGSTFTVQAGLRCFNLTSTTQDMSVDGILSVNGIILAVDSLDIEVPAAIGDCESSCGSCDGGLTCTDWPEDLPGAYDCYCGVVITTDDSDFLIFGGIPLDAGDAIRVDVIVAPGSVNESYTLDDFASITYSGAVPAPVPPASRSALRMSVSPNPAQTRCRVQLDLPAAGPVSVDLYDVRGRVVRSLAERRLAAGATSIALDLQNAEGTALSPGVYFVRACSGADVVSAKLAISR